MGIPFPLRSFQPLLLGRTTESNGKKWVDNDDDDDDDNGDGGGSNLMTNGTTFTSHPAHGALGMSRQ